jgi:membrane DNA delivery protein
MTNRIFADIMTLLTAVIGLAIIATLVSKQAQTGSVLTQAGSAFSGILKAATSPVSSGGTGLPQLPSLPGN